MFALPVHAEFPLPPRLEAGRGDGAADHTARGLVCERDPARAARGRARRERAVAPAGAGPAAARRPVPPRAPPNRRGGAGAHRRQRDRDRRGAAGDHGGACREDFESPGPRVDDRLRLHGRRVFGIAGPGRDRGEGGRYAVQSDRDALAAGRLPSAAGREHAGRGARFLLCARPRCLRDSRFANSI